MRDIIVHTRYIPAVLLLINVFTEPHFDGGDLKDGWAIMTPWGRRFLYY